MECYRCHKVHRTADCCCCGVPLVRSDVDARGFWTLTCFALICGFTILQPSPLLEQPYDFEQDLAKKQARTCVCPGLRGFPALRNTGIQVSGLGTYTGHVLTSQPIAKQGTVTAHEVMYQDSHKLPPLLDTLVQDMKKAVAVGDVPRHTAIQMVNEFLNVNKTYLWFGDTDCIRSAFCHWSTKTAGTPCASCNRLLKCANIERASERAAERVTRLLNNEPADTVPLDAIGLKEARLRLKSRASQAKKQWTQLLRTEKRLDKVSGQLAEVRRQLGDALKSRSSCKLLKLLETAYSKGLFKEKKLLENVLTGKKYNGACRCRWRWWW